MDGSFSARFTCLSSPNSCTADSQHIARGNQRQSVAIVDHGSNLVGKPVWRRDAWQFASRFGIQATLSSKSNIALCGLFGLALVRQRARRDGRRRSCRRCVPTRLLYLTDSQTCTLPVARLLRAEAVEAEGQGPAQLALILDSTIFHPQGGGQPADHGTIQTLDQSFALDISSAMLSLDGVVRHVGKLTGSDDLAAWERHVGQEVRLSINAVWRAECARYHSAGHLLDAACKRLGLQWQAVKGRHFPDGAYNDYKLIPQSRRVDMTCEEEKQRLMAELEQVANELVRTGGAATVSYEGSQAGGLTAAESREQRRVEIAGYNMPCGGTHVRDVLEIGGIAIRKLRHKKGNIRLSYTVID